MITPALRTARLLLLPYIPSLVTEQHVEWLNDKELMQYSEQRHKEHSLSTQMVFVSYGPPYAGRHLWLIRCGGKDIGTFSCYIDDRNARANMGVLIGPREYHGQGFAAEAWTRVTEWLFNECGLYKVEAGCMAENWPMRRVALTCGMRLEAQIPCHFKIGDRRDALVLYGRFKHDEHHSIWEKVWSEPFWKSGRNA